MTCHTVQSCCKQELRRRSESTGLTMLRAILLCSFHRIEVLGALVSVLSTWLVTGILLWEAVDRIRNPVDVNGKCEFHLSAASMQCCSRSPQWLAIQYPVTDEAKGRL